MSIIDIAVHTLSCNKCNTKETNKILDKGSVNGGSSWQSSASFLHFETTWKGGGKEEPELIIAKCKKCQQNASHKCIYSP